MKILIKQKSFQLKSKLWKGISFILLFSFQLTYAQNPFVITSTSSSNFTVSGLGNGFNLSTTIKDQIGNGFRVDATFNTSNMSATTPKTLMFSVGMKPSGSFVPVFSVYIQNRQVIVERRVGTPSGDQMFAMPSWNTTMYAYGKSNVHLYFWIDDLAMKLYVFETSTNLASTDVKRTCELQFYGMDASRAKPILTNTGNGTLSIVVPQTAAHFVKTEIATAQDIKRTPISMNAVQGGEAAILNAPLCSSNLHSDEEIALRSTEAAEAGYSHNKPLDPTSPEFMNLPTSYAIIENTASEAIDKVTTLSNRLSVSPIPTDDHLYIDLMAAQAAPGRLELVDIMGRIVYNQAIYIEKGRNQYNVSLKEQALSAGLYLVYVQELGENNDSTRFYTAKVILK